MFSIGVPRAAGAGAGWIRFAHVPPASVAAAVVAHNRRLSGRRAVERARAPRAGAYRARVHRAGAHACRTGARRTRARGGATPAPAAPAPTLSCQVGGAVLAVAPSRAAGVDCYVLREGAEPAAFVKALDSDATDDAETLCPQVYAIRGGTAMRLKADTGPLVRTSDCCNVTRLEAKGEARLVASGAGPDCFGGRDEAELDAAYAITGEGLRAIAR